MSNRDERAARFAELPEAIRTLSVHDPIVKAGAMLYAHGEMTREAALSAMVEALAADRARLLLDGERLMAERAPSRWVEMPGPSLSESLAYFGMSPSERRRVPAAQPRPADAAMTPDPLAFLDETSRACRGESYLPVESHAFTIEQYDRPDVARRRVQDLVCRCGWRKPWPLADDATKAEAKAHAYLPPGLL